MRTFACLIFLAFLALPIPAACQPPVTPPHAEIRFHDGSNVRMTLLQPTLEIQTKYGKLEVPYEDIRKVEFGLHVPPDIRDQVALNLKRLASDVYKERDAAEKALLQIGLYAYRPLERAAKSTDHEVAHRAAALVKQIAARTSADLLKLREDDVIHTVEFPVTGKITARSLKAHSAHFGEVALKLTDLRTMQVRRRGGQMVLALDAAQHGSALDQWRDTGMSVDTGMRLAVASTGQVDLWPQGPGQFTAQPKGYNTAGKGGQFMAGALIGKIGEQGQPFFLGDQYDAAAAQDGILYLLIVPSPWGSASTGSFQVKISTGDPK